jgi:5-(carboxyamino)imidazole ribonucleotide mutase
MVTSIMPEWYLLATAECGHQPHRPCDVPGQMPPQGGAGPKICALTGPALQPPTSKAHRPDPPMTTATQLQVGVVMGSSSDWDTMQHAVQILQHFGVAHEARVVSAHRMPDELFSYAESAQARGLQAIIAGAGGAAHLPGMLAAKTTVPVLGVPVASRHLQGVDSLHSIVQMPKGIPVATFAIGNAGAANAALFAVAMLALHDSALGQQLQAFRAEQTRAAQAMTLPPA